MKLHERLPLLINMQLFRWKNFQELKMPGQKDVDVIVSLTTIESRLQVVETTIKSLLLQKSPPKKVVLWLHHSLENALPSGLQALLGGKFEVRYTNLDSPHCKLVPTLMAFPNETVVTCDDDQYYSHRWLSTLLKISNKNPNKIVAQKFRRIKFSESGEPLPYRQWSYDRTLNGGSRYYLPLGVGGILYPKNCFHEDVLKEELYMDLCPKADDLWFKVMAYLKGTEYAVTPREKPYYEVMGSQLVTLRQSNIDEDKNITQWLALRQNYPELNEL